MDREYLQSLINDAESLMVDCAAEGKTDMEKAGSLYRESMATAARLIREAISHMRRPMAHDWKGGASGAT